MSVNTYSCIYFASHLKGDGCFCTLFVFSYGLPYNTLFFFFFNKDHFYKNVDAEVCPKI